MKAFFKYFGSKHQLSKKYPKPIGTICEPFAGSACYSVFYEADKSILIDKDERVVKIWKYLINTTEEEILNLPLIKPGESIDDITWPNEAAKLLASCWVNTSPFRKKFPSVEICSRYGWDKRLWGDNIKQRISEQLKKIRNWEAILGDYELAPKVDTIFIDPPYQKEGIAYKFGSKSLDYENLASWIKNREEKIIIVCEQSGADWLEWNIELNNNRRVPRNNKSSTDNHEVAFIKLNI